MNSIDAIEGAVKYILNQMHHLSTGDKLDDTEYIRNIKAIIEGCDAFVKENREIIENPEVLKNVLYTYSKELWLSRLTSQANQEQHTDNENLKNESDEYHNYYYDYIYHHGVYPL